eukprot:tig00000042_g15567.t1
MGDDAPFSTKALVAKMRAAQPRGDEVPLVEFVAAMREIGKVFDMLGSAFGFVKKDITEKTGAVWDAYSQNPGKFTTMQSMMNWEKANGRWEGEFRSKKRNATRHSVRLRWLLEFMMIFCANLANPGMSSNQCVGDAYKRALEPHHPWVIRKAVGLAVHAVPSKEALCKKMGVEQGEALADMNEFSRLAAPTLDSINRFHAQNGCNDLP